ncbi:MULTISPECIES: DUF4298 domain-containing protein [Helcococcus]|uniref:DUF4298 domain-containing protein n=1 Tax=Helcococcus bovis TaxID=3153252 RepID=A0ABW9F599_9FIRM
MKYEYITKMENILNEHEEKLSQLKEILTYLEENFENYSELNEYYYSDQRHQDLLDDESGLIPDDLNRGVLSEDGIYNLMADYYDATVQMLELSTKFIKNH